MFNNYKIKNNELYLYVDDKCEIGDIFNNSKNEKILSRRLHFIYRSIAITLSPYAVVAISIAVLCNKRKDYN